MGLMSWLSRKRARAEPNVKAAASGDPLAPLIRIWPRLFSPANYSLENSELIFSAVTRISNALSCMPIRLYRGLKVVEDDPRNDLIGFAPNPNMTACNFIKTWEACRDTTGNGYALKVVDDTMQPVRVDILNPLLVTPLINQDTNELWYRINAQTATGQKTIYLHNYYVLHVQFVSTDGMQGVNPVKVLFNTLKYGEQIEKFSVDQLDKGINAAICLEAPNNLGELQVKKLVETFTRVYKETGGNILMLESGVKAHSLNLSPVDSKLFDVERISRSKVAMVYNIPPHLLGDYSDISFNTMEQQMLEFLTLTMLPIVRMYEQELDRKLLTPIDRQRGYHFSFDTDALLLADAATRAEVNFKAVRSGWKSPNEARAECGKPPKENGDELMVSRDMIPLSVAVKQPELLLKGGKVSSE